MPKMAHLSSLHFISVGGYVVRGGTSRARGQGLRAGDMRKTLSPPLLTLLAFSLIFLPWPSMHQTRGRSSTTKGIHGACVGWCWSPACRRHYNARLVRLFSAPRSFERSFVITPPNGNFQTRSKNKKPPTARGGKRKGVAPGSFAIGPPLPLPSISVIAAVDGTTVDGGRTPLSGKLKRNPTTSESRTRTSICRCQRRLRLCASLKSPIGPHVSPSEDHDSRLFF